MAGYDWLTKPAYSRGFVFRVLLKAALLFGAVNLLFALFRPLDLLNKLSVYNTLVPGRTRLAYADNPAQAYSLTIADLDALFTAHVISVSSPSDDAFRVVLLGDSSVWGWLLTDQQTFNACLAQMDAQMPDGRRIEAYNLGYPITNIMKDFLFMDYSLRYEPDAFVWLVTLEGFYDSDQFKHPVLQDNRADMREMLAPYNLSLDMTPIEGDLSFWDQTLIGQRRALADWLRFQIYGLAWRNTGIDHANPRFFRSPIANLPDSEGVADRPEIMPGINIDEYLAFDVLDAAVNRAESAGVPMLLVNEPIFISDGLNNDLRYNELYPRWLYDAYRAKMDALATAQNWRYLDLWDAVPNDRFTDFPLHYDAEWTCRIAERLLPEIQSLGS